VSEPIEVLEKRLTAISHGRETAKGFHFFCQAGARGWEGGVVTLQISGTGWTLVSQRAPGSEEDDSLYSVYLAQRDLRALSRKLLEQPFWKLDTSRWEPTEDETNIHLRIADTGRAFAWSAQLWSGERRRQRILKENLTLVQTIVTMVSEGEIQSLGI
jgi:hypothetical protein